MTKVTIPSEKTLSHVSDVPVHIDPRMIQEKLQEIDITNSQSIVSFGSGIQKDLTTLSNSMLEGIRNKDIGPAGNSLRKMVTILKGFDVDELDPNKKSSFITKIFRRTTPVAEFIAKYETVRNQIDTITNDLLAHETTLLKDIKFLDKLYEKSLQFYQDLAVYIVAGDKKLKQLDTKEIPQLRQQVEATQGELSTFRAQELHDLNQARNDLERRIHDLKLTRQVTMQSLPSIRLVQENDKALVTKINSTLMNTIPLWQTQLAQAVTIQRAREAARSIKTSTDLTNDLLARNAENLNIANKEIRTQVERGVFDIEVVKQANTKLIQTIQDSLTISEEGKARRYKAENELSKMEQELKQTLMHAKQTEL